MTFRLAHSYLNRGWAPIPLAHSQKRPPEGFPLKQYFSKKATFAELREWWTRWPDAGIGLLTGQISGGLIVVDIDPRNGGGQSIRGLHQPPTFASATGGGGWHYFYRADFPVKKRIDALPGIDILGDGALAVMPPSVHPSGKRYRLAIDESPVTPPTWVVELIRSTPKREHPNRKPRLETKPNSPLVLSKPFGLIHEGGRNTNLFRAACGFARTSYKFHHLLKRVQGLNQKACLVPLPEREILSLAANAWRYAKGRIPPFTTTAHKHPP